MTLIQLQCGQPYPFQTPPANTAVADFLRDTGNALIMSLDPFDATDEWAIREGPITAGLLSVGTALLLVFQFHNPRGRPILSFDCPFDARLIPVASRALPSMETPASRLAFQVYAVDGSGLLRGLRYLTLPLDLSTQLLAVAMDQIAAGPADLSRAQQQIAQWLSIPATTLQTQVRFAPCGR